MYNVNPSKCILGNEYEKRNSKQRRLRTTALNILAHHGVINIALESIHSPIVYTMQEACRLR
jgi:hypothetical protein